MQTALVTGASSGIGYEIAKIHASRGGHLVITARNEAKLNALKLELEAKYTISVHIIVKDLSLNNAALEIYNELKTNNIQINYLINNAGYGLYGSFQSTDWELESKMIQLNIIALTQLTKLFLPTMIENKFGKILNVASTAAFVPGCDIRNILFASARKRLRMLLLWTYSIMDPFSCTTYSKVKVYL